jgi:2-hydroxyacyl-CoA lyase 1
LPGDLIAAACPTDLLNSAVNSLPDSAVDATPPQTMAAPAIIEQACQSLSTARRPLIIIGKGSAYADRAGSLLQRLIERYNLPFIAMPMAKGLLPDRHRNNVAAARSLALQRADVAVIFGGRLNWQLHFGQQPRWDAAVRVITVDICYEESVTTPPGQPERLSLIGDIPLVVWQLLTGLKTINYNVNFNIN